MALRKKQTPKTGVGPSALC